MLVVFLLSACEKKNAAIQTELRLLEKTVKDTTQPESIRKGAEIFANILSEKQEIAGAELTGAHWNMMEYRNTTTIATYVAFLKALEKRLPDSLPSLEAYQAMKSKVGSAWIIEYNVAQTAMIMSNTIQNITLYNDPTADLEVEGFLKRLNKKHGASETGKELLKLLNVVHNHGLIERSEGIKPWESPKTPRTL